MNILPVIRPIQEKEFGFLCNMLYNAIFVPPGKEKLPENIIELPEISKYIKAFGRKDDLCFVAEVNGVLVGAVWTRHFSEKNKSYGFVDSDTPELSMAVLEKFRKKGIGTLLLKTMIVSLTDHGYKQVSLSVDKLNYAYNLYRKFGFRDLKTVDESITMILNLKD